MTPRERERAARFLCVFGPSDPKYTPELLAFWEDLKRRKGRA